MASESQSATMQKAKTPSVTERLARIENKLGIGMSSEGHSLRNGLIIAAVTIGSGAVITWATYVTLGVISLKQATKSAGIDLIAELQNPSSSAQLQANLSTVVAQVQTARVKHTNPNLGNVTRLSEAVSQVIQSSPNAPEAWQAASLLISYRSDATPNRTGNSCINPSLDVGPINGFAGNLIAEEAKISNCTLALDDLASYSKTLQAVVNTHGPSVVVKKLILRGVNVIYNGGQLIPVETIEFDHCTFDFQERNLPPAPAQRVTQQLLASTNLEKADVHVANIPGA